MQPAPAAANPEAAPRPSNVTVDAWTSASHATTAARAPVRALGARSPDRLQALQRTAGNRAVLGTLARLAEPAATAPATGAAPPQTAAPPSADGAPQQTVAPPPALTRLLKVGVQGDDVRALQERLNQRGESLTPDGVFGPQTRAAVVRAQQALGVAADGVVGPQTWGALTGATPATGQPPGVTPGTPPGTTPPPAQPPIGGDTPPTGDQTQLRQWVTEALTKMEQAAAGAAGGAAAPGGSGHQPEDADPAPEPPAPGATLPASAGQTADAAQPAGSGAEPAGPAGPQPVAQGGEAAQPSADGQQAPVEVAEPITWSWLDVTFTLFLRNRVVAGGNSPEDHAARVGVLDQVEAAVTPLQQQLEASGYAGLGGNEHERATVSRFLENVRTMQRFYASLAGSVIPARPDAGGGYATQQRPEDPRRAQLIGTALADVGKVWAQPPDGNRRGWQYLKHIFDVSMPSHGIQEVVFQKYKRVTAGAHGGGTTERDWLPSWCGIGANFWVKQVKPDQPDWKVAQSPFPKHCRQRGPGELPQVGDVVISNKYGHHGIITWVDPSAQPGGNMKIRTVECNTQGGKIMETPADHGNLSWWNWVYDTFSTKG